MMSMLRRKRTKTGEEEAKGEVEGCVSEK